LQVPPNAPGRAGRARDRGCVLSWPWGRGLLFLLRLLLLLCRTHIRPSGAFARVTKEDSMAGLGSERGNLCDEACWTRAVSAGHGGHTKTSYLSCGSCVRNANRVQNRSESVPLRHPSGPPASEYPRSRGRAPGRPSFVRKADLRSAFQMYEGARWQAAHVTASDHRWASMTGTQPEVR
jgi:hypothetical protein